MPRFLVEWSVWRNDMDTNTDSMVVGARGRDVKESPTAQQLEAAMIQGLSVYFPRDYFDYSLTLTEVSADTPLGPMKDAMP